MKQYSIIHSFIYSLALLNVEKTIVTPRILQRYAQHSYCVFCCAWNIFHAFVAYFKGVTVKYFVQFICIFIKSIFSLATRFV